MAYALVGALGAEAQATAVNTAVSPAWGTSENRTADNLLICWVSGWSSATFPTTPSGWNIAIQKAGTSCSATVYWRIATGGDAAPSIAAAASTAWGAQLGEFSGNTAASPVDQTANAAGTTSPLSANAAASDVAVGELLVAAAAMWYSSAATKTTAHTLSTVGSTNSNSNDGIATTWHWNFAWATTTSNSGADQDSFAYTITKITGTAVVLASFKLAAVGGGPAPLKSNGQAVKRSTFWSVGLPQGWKRRSGLLIPQAV
jgi:hypothetical protein